MDGTPLVDVASESSEVEGPALGEERIGEVLDRRYRIDELIGEGGMAHVYRITHTMIGKSLAAKVVRHELRNDEEVIRRFLREAQIVSSIKHPNVVDISDYGETPEGGAFCVMELLRGRTLADAIDQDGAFSPEAALSITLQICQGLNHSHEAGVVHRDLKPQNIFICDPKNGKEPVVKLIDFGVARAGNRITVAGAVLGTPEYMSPEQVRGAPVDAGADLYALGIILFELLTAAVPYRSDDVAVTMQSHLHAPTPKMTLVDPELERLAQTQALIERLMSKDRAERPGTADEAAVLLQQAMAADLGAEATERVVRSTLAIGSGAIVQTPAQTPAPTRPWSDRQMEWNPELQSSASPVSAAADPLQDAPRFDTTDVDPPAEPKRRRSLPWIVAATSLLAAGGTVGGYAAMGGFQPASATPSATPTVEVVSAPVPQDGESSDSSPTPAPAPTAEAGGKSPAVEQTPPGEASVPSKTADAVVGDAAAKPEISDTTTQSKGEHEDHQRSPRRPTQSRRKANKPRTSKPRQADGNSKTPGASQPSKGPSKSPSANPPSKPSEPKPAPASTPKSDRPSAGTQDGDLRNPFG